jgi:hypothetical protein
MPTDQLREEFSQVLIAQDQTSRSVLPGRLFRDAVPRDGICAEPFFELFAECLAEAANTEKQILAMILSPMIRNRNVAGLRWLSNIDLNPRLLNFDSELVRDFRERLRTEINSPKGDGEATTVISHIAAIPLITKQTMESIDS